MPLKVLNWQYLVLLWPWPPRAFWPQNLITSSLCQITLKS